MDDIGKIKNSIRKLSGATQGIVFTAQVKSVEGETCTIALGNTSLSDVRLRAVINGNAEKLYIKPKKDSFILVIDLSNGNYRDLVAITYSEVETINIKISETTIDIDKDGVVFNGGKLNGLVKIDELKKNLDSLKTFVEGMHAAIPAAIFAVGIGTDASGTTGQTSYNTAMTGKNIVIGDMENKKVKQ